MTVLIVGAGPTGLTAACALLRRGIEVRIVDAAEHPPTTSRALGLQPRGQEVLSRIGALGDLPRRGIDTTGTAIYLNGRKAVDVGAALNSAGPRMLFIPQTEIEANLRARLTELGGEIEWNTALRELNQDAEGVDARFDTGEVLRAEWVIGCDGAHSQVRKSAGIDFPGSPLMERFLLADVHAEFPGTRGQSGLFLSQHGQFVAMPLPHSDGDLWRLMAPASAEDDGELGQTEILEQLHRHAAERANIPELRINRAEWTSVFRIQRRLADTYRAGRILLAGDAAHIHSPLGGQGMNTGIGDAENLAFKLALVVSGHAGTELMDSYGAERRPVAESVLSATSVGTKLGFAEQPFVRRLLAALIPLLRIPAVRNRLLGAASQLDTSYRGGPLATHTARRFTRNSGPRPGDRVPNILTRDSEGRHAPLHEQLRTGWAVLSGGMTEEHHRRVAKRIGAGNLRELVPETGTPHEVFLVRPDAHLAWRGTSAKELARWLDDALCQHETVTETARA